MNIIFAGCIKIFLQIVLFGVATVRDRNTYLNEKRPPFVRRPFFAVENLFDKRDDEGGDDSFDFSGIVFGNKGGKTFAISHIFVFFPSMRNRHTVFKLAAIIIKRNVGEHKNQILSSFRAQAVPLLPANILMNCPFIVHIITQHLLQNQVAVIEKTDENYFQKLCSLNKNEKA